MTKEERETLIAEARRLRHEEGKTYAQIAVIVDKDERTVGRWLSDGSRRRAPRPRVPESPRERLWPADWTVDSLSDLPGFKRDAWEGNLGLIEVAQSQENMYIPWYFRRMVETARRYQVDNPNTNPWLYAIAAAPVLAEWLSTPEFVDLGLLIERVKPWQGKQEQGQYKREATDLGRQIEIGIGRALILPPKSVDALYPVEMLLRFLANWQPTFHKTPFMARLARFQIGQLVLLLLRNPKPVYGGVEA